MPQKKTVKGTNSRKPNRDHLKDNQDKKVLAKQMKNKEDKKKFNQGNNRKRPAARTES